MSRSGIDICDKLSQYEAELRKQYKIPDGRLYFRKLNGGICNAPVYVYQLQDGQEKPIFVLKLEQEDQDFVNARFAALDEMAARGFKFNPIIFRNCNGDYLSKLGDEYYSAIEYISSDEAHQEKNIGLEAMLELTARFHQHSKDLTQRPALDQSRYALHIGRHKIIDEVDSFQIGVDFFKSEKFMGVRELYKFYATKTAGEMFDRLPKQFIHGDNHQGNLVFRNGEAFYIDLDARRYDVRLYDLCSCIRHGGVRIQQEYIELAKNGELFTTIDQHYGLLTSDEKNCFYLILAFSYVEFFSWAMCRIKRNLMSDQYEAAGQLVLLLIGKAEQLLQLLDDGLIDCAQIHHAVHDRQAAFATLFHKHAYSEEQASVVLPNSKYIA